MLRRAVLSCFVVRSGIALGLVVPVPCAFAALQYTLQLCCLASYSVALPVRMRFVIWHCAVVRCGGVSRRISIFVFTGSSKAPYHNAPDQIAAFVYSAHGHLFAFALDKLCGRHTDHFATEE